MTQLVTHKQLTHLVPWWPRFTAANYPQKPSWTDPGHTPHPKVMMCHLKYSSGWSIHQPTSRHHRMYCVGSSTTAENRPITSLLPIPFIIHKFDLGHSKTLFMWQHYLSLALSIHLLKASGTPFCTSSMTCFVFSAKSFPHSLP